MHVDFYYSIASRYSYLAASQLLALEEETHCRVQWHALNSVRLLKERGQSPFDGPASSGQYDWTYRETDARRWAELYDIPFVEPRGRMDYDSESLALAATAAKRLGRAAEFSRELFAELFGGETLRIDGEAYRRCAQKCGLDPDSLSAERESTATRAALEQTMRSAHRVGVFGVPTFVVGRDLFWGNDRLPLLRRRLFATSASPNR
ncbi:MAG TPA: DsbA family protein [Polyangiaceae bacterium]